MGTTVTKAKPKPMPMQLTAKPAPKPLPMPPEDDPSAGADAPEPAKVTKPLPKATKVIKEYGTTDGHALDEPAAVVITKQATATVSKKFKDGSEVDETTPIGDIQKFTSQPAMIDIAMSVTRNMGNFESVKIHVGLTVPCENTDEGKSSAFEEAKTWVDEKVGVILAEVDAENQQ